ncbi:co-chaperone GroES [bacterium]
MNDKRKLLVIGDRVLLAPDSGEDRTAVGLYLPKTVTEKDDVQSGRIVATGPGQPLPSPKDMDEEPWKASNASNAQHVPMQAQIGDHAIFLRKAAIEIKYEEKTYLVVPQAAILVLLRDAEDSINI